MMATAVRLCVTRGTFTFVADNSLFVPMLSPQEMWQKTIHSAGEAAKKDAPVNYSALRLKVSIPKNAINIDATMRTPPTQMTTEEFVRGCLQAIYAKIHKLHGQDANCMWPVTVKITITP
jgi:hypothetical protein